MGYTKSVMQGFGWLTMAKLLSRGFSLIKVALVARIMGPEEFGLYGVIAMVIALFETVTETGINVVLIRKENSENMLSTAWIVSIVRGILIGLLILLAAVPVSSFFGNEQLIGYIMFASLVPLVKGWINPSLALFQKRLEFHKDTLLRTSVIMIDALAGICLVLIYRNLWGLMYAFLISAMAEVVLTWWFCPIKPRFGFKVSQLKELLSFSKWFNLVVISNYMASQMDTILIGKVLGLQSLGIYQSAYKVVHAPVVEVADLASQSTFPVYSKMQHDVKRMIKAYMKAGGFSAMVTGVLVFGLIIFRYQIINLVFGPEWIAAVAVVPILALAAWLRSLIAPASAVMLSRNRPDLLAQVSSIRIVIMAVGAVFLLESGGILGMAYCVLLGNLASIPLLWRSIRLISREE